MRRLAVALAVPALVLSVLTGSAAIVTADGTSPTGSAGQQRHPPKCC